MRIPVFHDDQHGTAIISGGALRGAKVEEIVNLTAIAVVDAQETGAAEPVAEVSLAGV